MDADELAIGGALQAIQEGRKAKYNVRDAMARSLSDFLLPETLALLLTPSPRSASSAESAAPPSDSETEDEVELLESSRLVQVREVFEYESLIEIVDRRFVLDAFVPQSVRDALEAQYGFRFLSDIEGCVVRLDKYHFSTIERCFELDAKNDRPHTPKNVTAARVQAPRMCLCIEELTLINDVKSMPSLLKHPVVEAVLRSKTSEERGQLFVQRQGLSSTPVWAEPSKMSINKRKASNSDSSDEDTSAPPPSRRPRRTGQGVN